MTAEGLGKKKVTCCPVALKTEWFKKAGGGEGKGDRGLPVL